MILPGPSAESLKLGTTLKVPVRIGVVCTLRDLLRSLSVGCTEDLLCGPR